MRFPSWIFSGNMLLGWAFGAMIWGGFVGIQEAWTHRGKGYIFYDDDVARVSEAEYKRDHFVTDSMMLLLGAWFWCIAASHSRPKDRRGRQPSFPVWLDQQSDISMQDGLDRYIEEFMSLQPVDVTSSKPRTPNELTREIAIMGAEIALLEECAAYYEGSLRPEFNSLVRSKQLALNATISLLTMTLTGDRVLREARQRIDGR